MACRPTIDEFTNMSVEDINSMLRSAEHKLNQLLSLHIPCSDHNGRRRNEEDPVTVISLLFREMMSASYSVIDYCYYFLYCYLQKSGKPSLQRNMNQIKAPVKQTLKCSLHSGRDEQISRQRNEFVLEQCRRVFGEGYEHDIRIQNSDLKWFQENALSLQAVIEVDKAGTTVQTCPEHGQKCPQDGTCLNKAPNLLHAVRFCYEPDYKRCFNPTRIQFEKLESVANIAGWSDTTVFMLLHFFRNFTLHRSFRSLISCSEMPAYFNEQTLECKLTVGDNFDVSVGSPWVSIDNLSMILVPEVSRIRVDGQPECFYKHPLVMVCAKILNFVKCQRFNLLKIVNKQSNNYCNLPVHKGACTSADMEVAQLYGSLHDIHTL